MEKTETKKSSGGADAAAVGAVHCKPSDEVPKKGLSASQQKEGNLSEEEPPSTPGAVHGKPTDEVPKKGLSASQNKEGGTLVEEQSSSAPGAIRRNSGKKLGEKKSAREERRIQNEGSDANAAIAEVSNEQTDESAPGAVRSNSTKKLGEKKSNRARRNARRVGFLTVLGGLRKNSPRRNEEADGGQPPMDSENPRSDAAAHVEDEDELPIEASCEVARPPANGDEETKPVSVVQKYRTLLIVGAILVVVVAVATVVPLAMASDGDGGNGDSVEASPVTLPPILNVDPSIIPGVHNDTWAAMFDTKSPQYLAYDWVAKDPNLEHYDEWQLLQRFALATFYYAMGGPGWELASWLDYETSECQWLADPKTCHEDGNFKLINITEQRGFGGSPPPELSLLTRLEGMDFSNNLLDGNLTDLFGGDFDHPNFQVLWCSKCRLSGSIPGEITQMTNLRGLILRENDLTGKLPPEIGQLSLLQHLELEENQFSGPIPSTIGDLQALEVLGLSGNQFTSLPSQVGKLTELVNLDVAENLFSQTILSEIGALNKLQVLELEGNQMQGPIPSEIGSLTLLFRLLLNRNQLSGTIPEEFGSLSNLEQLWLNKNQLVGPIPSSMGQMTSMTVLEMIQNELSSTIPSELGLLVELQELRLSINQLSGTIPSELASLAYLTSLNVKTNPSIVQQVPEEFCEAGQLRFNMTDLVTDWCDDEACCAHE